MSLVAPVDVRLMFPFPNASAAPETVIVPASVTETLPPDSLIPVTFSAPLSTKLISPLVVFVPWKLDTRLILFSTVPVAEFVVNNPPVIRPDPDSLISLPAVRLTAPAVVRWPAFIVRFCPAMTLKVPDLLTTSALTRMSLVAPIDVRLTLSVVAASTVPRTVIVPASVIETLPPVSLIPVMLSAPLFIKLILPLEVFVAWKLVTRFVLFSVVPPVELVVSRPPVIRPVPDSSIELPAATVMVPVVVRLPAFSVTFLPAPRFKFPEPLITSRFTRISLPDPVDVSVTFPAVAA